MARRLLGSMSCEAATPPHRTPLLLLLLLASLLEVGTGKPLPSSSSRTNATLLERRWETLFSRSVLGVSGEKPEQSWESDYLLGIKRLRRLYCNVGIGFHLQVLPDGRISGAHDENQYSLLEISTVERGVVSLYGVKSEMFVAMNSWGRLYGTFSKRSASSGRVSSPTTTTPTSLWRTEAPTSHSASTDAQSGATRPPLP
ncbi:fibroblast growth factor 4B-like isoform 2-T2 [Synchiropus picturatus]